VCPLARYSFRGARAADDRAEVRGRASKWTARSQLMRSSLDGTEPTLPARRRSAWGRGHSHDGSGPGALGCILYPDGLVVGSSTRETKQLRLDPADKPAFAHFIGTVPRPTAWERAWRIRAAALGWAVWLVLALASYAVMSILVLVFKWAFSPGD
jgi:hypothetical protein